jgi:hypothetical protein
MGLQGISIILGLLAVGGGLAALLKPELIHRFADLFPRSTVPAWVLTALCCWLGAREAVAMHMGFLDGMKTYVPLIAVGVFIASVVYMKELLAARALGGFLLLIAVPITRTAAMSEAPLFQVVTAIVYLWVIYGIVLLMSPWYFRKIYKPFLENERLFKGAAFGKLAVGVLLLLLGVLVY